MLIHFLLREVSDGIKVATIERIESSIPLWDNWWMMAVLIVAICADSHHGNSRRLTRIVIHRRPVIVHPAPRTFRVAVMTSSTSTSDSAAESGRLTV